MFESTWSASVVTLFTRTVFRTSRTIRCTVPATEAGFHAGPQLEPIVQPALLEHIEVHGGERSFAQLDGLGVSHHAHDLVRLVVAEPAPDLRVPVDGDMFSDGAGRRGNSGAPSIH